MAKKKEEKTNLVRIDKRAVNAVKKHVGITRQSVGGFFALAALEKLDKEKSPNNHK